MNIASQRPPWIDPTWEQLPLDTWPDQVARTLRRNGVETWEQLKTHSQAQMMIWPGAGRNFWNLLKDCIDESGRTLSAPTLRRARALAAQTVLPVAIEIPIRSPHAGVYFIKSGPFIKIGISTNVCMRLVALHNANPHELTPLGFIRKPVGAFEYEQEIHRQFAPYRHRLEWFHEHLALVQFIAEHAQPWPSDL